MDATNRYLDAVKDRLSLPSDGRLAAHWGVSKQRISQYRNGTYSPNDARCLEIAEILGIPPEVVLLEIQADRAAKAGHSRLSEILSGAAARLAHVAATLAAVAVFLFGFYMPKDVYARSINYEYGIIPTSSELILCKISDQRKTGARPVRGSNC